MACVLFFGDVVGQAGCDCLRRRMPKLRKQYQPDVIVANGENSAEGNGITPHMAKIVRPANLHPSAPGTGWYLYDHPSFSLAVINLIGRVYMDHTENPFDTADRLLKRIDCPNILVDFHAEATAEKLFMGHYLDGRVSAVIGTHTHVATADERLLPKGTAYLTDAGMCGGQDSILGVTKGPAIERMRTGLPARFSNDTEKIELHGVILWFGSEGKVEKIERLTVTSDSP